MYSIDSEKPKTISGIEAIKKRPEMYMPNYKQDGVREIVKAIFDHFVAENMGDFASIGFDISLDPHNRKIAAEIDLSCIRDEEKLQDFSSINLDFNKSGVRIWLEETHAGKSGIGLNVVNAFCKNLWWEDHKNYYHYQNGELQTETELPGRMPFGYIHLELEPVDEIVF